MNYCRSKLMSLMILFVDCIHFQIDFLSIFLAYEHIQGDSQLMNFINKESPTSIQPNYLYTFVNLCLWTVFLR